MAIKVGDKVLVEGVECEVVRMRKECDNPICIVERSDTGAKQQVRLTEADLVKSKVKDKDEGKGDEGPGEDEGSGEGEGSGEKESTSEDKPEPESDEE